MNIDLYTLEQNLNYQIKEQQQLAEQLRKVNEATTKQKSIQRHSQLNKTNRKTSILNLLGR